MDQKAKDKISGLVWFLFSVYICVESLRLPLGSIHDPGAGFFPLCAGIILATLSVTILLQSRQGKPFKEMKLFFPDEKNRKMVTVLLALLLYASALEFLGFLLSTFLFLFFLFWAIERQKWYVVLLGSGISAFASYAVFELWLKAQLPRGFLGF